MDRRMVSVVAVLALLASTNVVGEEVVNFDYTGLPVTGMMTESIVSYTTIPASLVMPDCELVENQDDYTGADMTRCSTATEEPELEWSYLY